MRIDKKILKNAAWSLLELLLVLTLLGVVMSIALPSLPVIDPKGPKNPSLLHLFQDARLEALQSGRTLQLSFESVGDGQQTHICFQPLNSQKTSDPSESWGELIGAPFTIQASSGEPLYHPEHLPQGYFLELDAYGRPNRALLITQPPNSPFLLLRSGAVRRLPSPKRGP